MQVDWWTLAIQTVNFLIVVWLLSRFLYRPIRRVIEEREAADRAAAEAAEEKAQTAEIARREFEAKRAELAEARRAEEAKLHAEMEKERQAMLDAAGKEAEEMVEAAKDRIERERKQAFEELKDQIAVLARDMARNALGDRALAGEGLIDRVTEHLDNSDKTNLADLRADLAGSGHGMSVVTAHPASEDEIARWRDVLAARLDGAKVVFETDPGIIGGVELRFPHAVLSFSVADRLKRAADVVRA